MLRRVAWVQLCLPWHILPPSEMSARSCAKYAHRMVPLRNNVACSPTRIDLFSMAQFYSRSFYDVSLNKSKVFQQSRNMFLVCFNLHQCVIDHSDRSVQHFQLFVKMFCCTNHADPSRVKIFLQHVSKDLNLIFCCRCHKIISMTESIHKL